MKSLLLLTLFVTGATVFANEVAYVPAKLCAYAPYKSHRDFWDKSGKFCVESKGKSLTYDVTGMGEIKLRENGEWSNNEYAAALSPENRALVGQYKTYFVRYLATQEAVNGVMPFVAHVFFNWGPGTQTIYVFGEIRADQIVLNGFSNVDSIDGDLRAGVNTALNLLQMFKGNNPNRVGVDETKADDRARIKPVEDVLGKYRGIQTPAPIAKP